MDKEEPRSEPPRKKPKTPPQELPKPGHKKLRLVFTTKPVDIPPAATQTPADTPEPEVSKVPEASAPRVMTDMDHLIVAALMDFKTKEVLNPETILASIATELLVYIYAWNLRRSSANLTFRLMPLHRHATCSLRPQTSMQPFFRHPRPPKNRLTLSFNA